MPVNKLDLNKTMSIPKEEYKRTFFSYDELGTGARPKADAMSKGEFNVLKKMENEKHDIDDETGMPSEMSENGKPFAVRSSVPREDRKLRGGFNPKRYFSTYTVAKKAFFRTEHTNIRRESTIQNGK